MIRTVALASGGVEWVPMSQSPEPRLSTDAAIVLALAETAVPFAGSSEDEAERWMRVLRMHGQVGSALQGLGLSEAPLSSAAQPRAIRIIRRRRANENIVMTVQQRACEFAVERGHGAVGTVDILFAVLDIYRGVFDRALYARGVTREELLERLADCVPASLAAERDW